MLDSEHWAFILLATCAAALVLLAFSEAWHQMETFEAWCAGHNGTIKGYSTMYCELPNGTTVGSAEVLN
jgi:hypothetical protein